MTNRPEVQQAEESAFQRAADTARAHWERVIDISKQRIAFHDRLLLISGGTITLSFTAATAFQSKSSHAQILYGGELTAAWILLISSMFLSLLFSWFTLSSLVHLNARTTIGRHITNSEFASYVSASLMTILNPKLLNLEKGSEVLLEHHNQYSLVTSRIAAVCGLVAQGCFYSAYICLFLFVRSNLFGL